MLIFSWEAPPTSGPALRREVRPLAGPVAADDRVAEVLNQATLHAGPLSRSQPFLVIVESLASIAFSVWVCGEHFTPKAGALVPGVVSFLGMCAGMVLLIRTTAATTEPVVAQ